MSAKHEPNAQQIADEKIYREMGLTDEEFQRVTEIIGRRPKLYGNRFI